MYIKEAQTDYAQCWIAFDRIIIKLAKAVYAESSQG